MHVVVNHLTDLDFIWIYCFFNCCLCFVTTPFSIRK